ncbi:MAG: cobalamin-dependent protein [Candidatus Moraniibacteriota bacterium]
MCVAQAARMAGHEVEYFQAPYHGSPEDVLAKIENIAVLALSLMQWNTPVGLRFAQKAKEINPMVKVAVGGVSPTCVPEHYYKNPSIDAVFVREGEEIFVKWLNAGMPSGIFKASRVIDWAKYQAPVDQTILKNLYFRGLAPAGNAWGFYFTRGCAGRCKFCCTPHVFPGGEIADDVLGAIRRLIHLREQGVMGVDIANATFNDNPTLVRYFCESLISSGLKMPWTAMCGTHGVDFDIYSLMAKAGCFKVGFGIENATQQGRKKLGKRGFASDKCHDSVYAAHDAGLLIRGFLMIGSLEDDEQTIDSVKELLTMLPIDDPRLAFITPFAGTTFHKQMVYSGQIIDDDWSHYTTNRPVIGTEDRVMELITMQREIIHWFWAEGPGRSQMIKRLYNDPTAWVSRYHRFLTRDIIPNGFLRPEEVPSEIL